MSTGLSEPVSARLPLPRWIVLLLLGLILTVPSWFTRDLWNPDEPRYAEVAREMVARGDWLVPHLNGEIYAEKPPLHFWLSALLQSAGLGVRSGRIVTAGFTIGVLFLTYLLARLWLPARPSWLSALILATAFQFLWIGRIGVLDMPLAFLTTGAVYAFARHRRDGGRWIAWFYVALGLGVLTKGPVAILVAGLGAVAIAAATRPARRSRPLHLLWGPLLTAAVVAAWVVPAIISGGEEYARIILFRQNVGRMVSSWSHQRPAWYYLVNLPRHFFPWIFLAPWGLVHAWRREGGPQREGGRSMALWFLAGLAAFSLISGKRGRYLVPLFPALAVPIGVLLDHLIAGRAGRAARHTARGLFLIQNLLLLLFGLLLLGLFIAGSGVADGLRAEEPQIATMLDRFLAWPTNAGILLFGAGMSGIALWGGVAAARGRPRASTHCLIGAMLVLSLGFDFVLAPRINEVKSGKEAALRANELIPPESGKQVALYPHGFSGVYNLYTGRIRMPVLYTPAELDRFLASPDAGLVVTTREIYERDSGELTTPHHLVETDRVGHRKIVFLLPGEPSG